MVFSRSHKRPEQPRRRTISDDTSEGTPVSSQFRRNQTLSQLRRYDDGPPQSERGRAHHLTQRRRKVGSIFALVLFAVIVLAVFIFQFTARVIIVGATAPLSQQISPSGYEERINEYLAINPVERLRFMLNEPALTSFVAAEYPEVADLSLSRVTNIVESGFTVNFREPIAGWQINNGQYYVDTEGVVFQSNYYTTPTVQIVDQSGISPEQGSVVASTRLLSFVGRVVSGAGERGYIVTSMSLPPSTTRQLEMRVDGQAGFIKLTIDRGAGEQVEDMDRALTFLRERGQTIEYLDVRVAGRAAYR